MTNSPLVDRSSINLPSVHTIVEIVVFQHCGVNTCISEKSAAKLIN